jgi:hypothetical protein
VELEALSTTASQNPDPALPFYDISRAEMHLRGTQKAPGVAQRRYAAAHAATAGKVTGAPDLQSVRGRISSLRRKLSFFFRYLGFCRAILGAGRARKSLAMRV